MILESSCMLWFKIFTFAAMYSPETPDFYKHRCGSVKGFPERYLEEICRFVWRLGSNREFELIMVWKVTEVL